MTTPAAIEIPRLPGERNERYEARVAYLQMGADRSLAHVGQKYRKSVGLMERWSAQDGWVEHARRYDEAMAARAAGAHQAQYEADLEAHRRDVMQSAARLAKILDGLEAQIMQALVGRTIEGKDGKTYVIPKMDITIAAISTLTRSRVAVADLKAHALDLPRLQALLAEQSGEADG